MDNVFAREEKLYNIDRRLRSVAPSNLFVIDYYIRTARDQFSLERLSYDGIIKFLGKLGAIDQMISIIYSNTPCLVNYYKAQMRNILRYVESVFNNNAHTIRKEYKYGRLMMRRYFLQKSKEETGV